MAVAGAIPTLQVENGRAQMICRDFASGATTGCHRPEHDRDYDCAIVPALDGTLGLVGPQDSTRAALMAGGRYFRLAGVERDVENVHSSAVVEVELKQRG
ncbi:MAG: cupin [Alphaproteobacteria bacterium]